MCLSKGALELNCWGKTDSKFLTDAAFICDKTATIRDVIK
jgi:hypothetical protein